MEYDRLGFSDLLVSRVAFGCEQLGGIDWGTYDRESVMLAVKRALDLGVNFFDTADVYALGGSEEALAEALGESRRNVIIATKVGVNWEMNRGAQRARTFLDLRPARVKQALEESLPNRVTRGSFCAVENPPSLSASTTIDLNFRI